jgi:hypothetical protein
MADGLLSESMDAAVLADGSRWLLIRDELMAHD